MHIYDNILPSSLASSAAGARKNRLPLARTGGLLAGGSATATRARLFTSVKPCIPKCTIHEKNQKIVSRLAAAGPADQGKRPNHYSPNNHSHVKQRNQTTSQGSRPAVLQRIRQRRSGRSGRYLPRRQHPDGRAKRNPHP